MNTIFLAHTKSGEYTLTIQHTDGRQVRLHSAFDPRKEAQRGVSSFQTTPGRLILVAGCALGYHIEQLKEHYPENTIVVIERYPGITAECRSHYPRHLDGCLVIHADSDIPALFEKLNIAQFKGSSVYFHRQSYSLDPQFYDRLIHGISQYLSSRISDLLTRFEFEERWVENIFRNIPQLPRSYPAGCFENAFTNIPAILVSAGPSLKENAALLRQYQHRALIACVDTAYKVLLKHGVSPHIVMVLDAQKHSLLHFLGIQQHSACLLADIVACPQLVRDFSGDIFVSTTSKYYDDDTGALQRETTPFVDWVEKHTGPFGDIQSGGSVATSLFDFLLNCGCNSITLIGQDLAYTGRKIHATGTYHNERWLAAINRFSGLENINQAVVRKRKIRYVPSVRPDEPVLTDYVLDLYKRWFSESASLVSIPVYNATADGAYIDGATQMDLDTIMQHHGSQNTDIYSIIDRIRAQNSTINISSLVPALRTLEHSCEMIRSCIEDAYTNDQSFTDVTAMVDSDELHPVFAPFLKRTRTYLDRHALEESRRRTLILDDIRRSSTKIQALIRTALRFTDGENTVKAE